MNAPVNQTDLTFVTPSAYSTANSTTYPTRRPAGGMFARLAALGQWIADAPRRRAVLDELSSLSDYELADIGLARQNISQVFDPDFARSRRNA